MHSFSLVVLLLVQLLNDTHKSLPVNICKGSLVCCVISDGLILLFDALVAVVRIFCCKLTTIAGVGQKCKHVNQINLWNVPFQVLQPTSLHCLERWHKSCLLFKWALICFDLGITDLTARSAGFFILESTILCYEWWIACLRRWNCWTVKRLNRKLIFCTACLSWRQCGRHFLQCRVMLLFHSKFIFLLLYLRWFCLCSVLRNLEAILNTLSIRLCPGTTDDITESFLSQMAIFVATSKFLLSKTGQIRFFFFNFLLVDISGVICELRMASTLCKGITPFATLNVTLCPSTLAICSKSLKICFLNILEVSGVSSLCSVLCLMSFLILL